MGGVKLMKPSMQKGQAKKADTDDGEKKYYKNANSWSFPLLYMIEALLDKNCTGDATTINLIGLSSISPTWGNDELAFHLNPEAAVFSNPQMTFLAIADGTMLTASPNGWGNSEERDSWFWTIGTWSGSLYPLTGNLPHSSSTPRESALVAAKSLALSHRVGQARKTMGEDNMCGGSIYPMLPKTQYKISQVFPQAQASAPCCNQLGETSMIWNEWRNQPGYDDYLFLIFRWTDCCINIL
jgi:conjugal transfer pilus assembly protein TraU